MKKVFLASVLVLMIGAAPAMAKEGFYLGVNVLFNEFGGDITNLDSGNGLGLRAGIGLNRYLATEGGLFQTDHDVKNGPGRVDFTGLTVDAKLSLPLSGSQIEPYIIAGVGTYEFDNNGNTTDATGGQLGIGLDIYLFPELNFNVGLTRRNITLDTNPERDGKVTSLDFGFTYHFI